MFSAGYRTGLGVAATGNTQMFNRSMPCMSEWGKIRQTMDICMTRMKEISSSTITLTLFGAVVVASAGAAQYQIVNQGLRLSTIETQQAADHDAITAMAVDVRWIRAAIEGS